MKIKTMMMAAALAGFAQAGVADEDLPKEEKRGMVSGLIVGASVGGPIGAGLGVMIGGGIIGKALAGNRIRNEKLSELTALNASYRVERDQLKRSSAVLDKDLKYMVALQASSWRHREIPVQFRTGSSHIEGHYETQLEKIAHVLTRNQDATVTLSGFTDRRGSEDANQDLSQQRVDTVERYLLAHGVKPGQILAKAYGESRPLQETESVESNFFDRRVVLALSLDLSSGLAAR